MPNNSHELIPIINKREHSEQWVDARTLHRFLEIGKDFSTWITGRIEEFNFIEGVDFSPNLGKSTGGRKAIEYTISMDMAKELAMLERNEKGRQARQYFIAAEKELRHVQSSLLSGYDELNELMQEVRSIEENGKLWFPVSQLSMLCGKSAPGGAMRRRLKKLADEGCAKKMVYRRDFRPAWYVTKEHVKSVLGVTRRTVTSTQFIKLLNSGK